jgi:hypothetical protein
MKRLTARILPISVAVLLFSTGLARAEFLNWTYSWSINPNPVIKPDDQATGGVTVALDAGGTGATASLIGMNQFLIRAAELTSTSSAEADNPDSFDNVLYTLTLTLTDNSDGSSGNLNFNAGINGNLTSTTSTLTNTFSDPLTQQLTLQHHTFTVTVDPSQATLPAPGSAAPTLLDAFITVQETDVPVDPPVAGVPEPTSFVLGSLAFSALGMGCWWKRKRRGKNTLATTG